MNAFTNNTPSKNRNLKKHYEYIVFEFENTDIPNEDYRDQYEFSVKSLKELAELEA